MSRVAASPRSARSVAHVYHSVDSRGKNLTWRTGPRVMPPVHEMTRRLIPAWMLAGLAAGCGGEIDVPGICRPDPPPSRALLRANDTDPSDSAGSTVLPNGRVLSSQTKLALGHPVDMVAHPTLPVVYVADARYFLDGTAERCPTTATNQRCGDDFKPTMDHRRGIHVLNVNGDTPQEIQDPSSICIEGTEPLSGRTCPGGTLPNDGAFGLAVTSDGKALFASTGLSGYVLRYAIDATVGTLRLTHAIPVEGFTAGLALAPGEKSLFVVRFLGALGTTPSSIAEIALAPSIDDPKPMPMPMPMTPPVMTVPTPKLLDQSVDLQGFGAYGCVALPEGDSGVRLWVSGFRAGPVQTVARSNPGEPLKDLGLYDAGKNPEGIARVDAQTVAVAVSDSDYVVLLRHRAADGDRAAGIERVGDPIFVGHYFEAIPVGASPTQLIVDGRRAYVTLATDNAMSVIDLDQRREVGAVPVGQDPSAIAMVKTTTGDRRLVIANGKSPYGQQCPPGSADCTIALATPAPVSDLEACWSDSASIPARIGPETCEGTSVTRPDIAKSFYLDETKEEGTLTILDPTQQSDEQVLAAATAITRARIEHPVGIVRERLQRQALSDTHRHRLEPHPARHSGGSREQDLRFLLGDLGDDEHNNPRNGERSLAVDTIRASKGWPAITPNLHALAKRFTSLDNFYDDAEVSMQGHSGRPELSSTTTSSVFISKRMRRSSICIFRKRRLWEERRPPTGLSSRTFCVTAFRFASSVKSSACSATSMTTSWSITSTSPSRETTAPTPIWTKLVTSWTS